MKQSQDSKTPQGKHTGQGSGASAMAEGKKINEQMTDKELKELLGLSEETEKEAYEIGEYGFKPEDYSDIGQAEVYAHVFNDCVRYNTAIGFLVYRNGKWETDSNEDIKAQGLAQDLTDAQLEEIKNHMIAISQKRVDATKAGNQAVQEEADKEQKEAEDYYKFVKGRRQSKAIRDTLKETQPKLLISADLLDKDSHLLNCPDGTIDLRTGKMKAHDHLDYCTKSTTVAPSAEGAEQFREFLHNLTDGNTEEQEYLQIVAGMCAIGEVRQEKMIIAFGKGGNGKSTFFNLLSMVLGDYAGTISPEVLIQKSKANECYEKADLRGKRLVVAAELNEGVLMNTAVVKHLTSTDTIKARQIYKAPIEFKPSHTLIMHTNHLPKVDTTDAGTWDRIAVVPFTHRFRGEKGEKKNYAEELYKKCGGAVLQWIIDGAKRFIESGYQIKEPDCVKNAVAEYRSDNDYIKRFIEDECCTGQNCSVGVKELYDSYKWYCSKNKEPGRTRKEFKTAMNEAGYPDEKKIEGMKYLGIRLKEGTTK